MKKIKRKTMKLTNLKSKNNYLATLFIGALMTLFTSCKDKGTDLAKGDGSTEVQAEFVPSPITGCYIHAEGRDTTWLNLKIEGENATAMFDWMPHQKDGATGFFIGKIKDNQITAKYTYNIEGSSQTEEVIFNIDGDKIIQQKGPLEEVGGIMVQKDKSKPTQQTIFVKGPCQN